MVWPCHDYTTIRLNLKANWNKESGDPDVEGIESLTAGFMGKGAGEVGLAHAGGTGEQQVLFAPDPLAIGQFVHQGLVQAPWLSEIDIFKSCILAKFGLAQPGLHLPGLAQVGFPINQQAQPFFKRQLVGWQLPLFFQGLDHAVQTECFQLIEGGMGQYGASLLHGWMVVVRAADVAMDHGC